MDKIKKENIGRIEYDENNLCFNVYELSGELREVYSTQEDLENDCYDGKCHICGNRTNWECERCGYYVCEECTVKYTIPKLTIIRLLNIIPYPIYVT